MAREFSGANLRAQRIAAGLRTEHVALAVDRGAHTLLRYEIGIAIPPTPVVGHMADAIGCTTDDFFTDVPDAVVDMSRRSA